MTWYAAHLILYYEVMEGEQDSYLCDENIVVIDAEDEDLAYKEAHRLGLFQAENTGDLSLEEEGHPPKQAIAKFAGVRKLTLCQVVPSQISSDMTDKQPHLLSGSEVTYSRIVVDSEQEVLALAHGDSVKVLYEE